MGPQHTVVQLCTVQMHLAEGTGTERQPRFCLAGPGVRLQLLEEGRRLLPKRSSLLRSGGRSGGWGTLVLILTKGLPRGTRFFNQPPLLPVSLSRCPSSFRPLSIRLWGEISMTAFPSVLPSLLNHPVWDSEGPWKSCSDSPVPFYKHILPRPVSVPPLPPPTLSHLLPPGASSPPTPTQH